MHTLVMDLEPGYIGTEPGFLYRFNRDLWQTITSSHLVLHTKPGRIKNFKLSGVTRQVETTGAQLLDNNSCFTNNSTIIKNTPKEIEIKNNDIYDRALIRAIVFKVTKSLLKSGNITFSAAYVHTGNIEEVGDFSAALYWGNDGSSAAKHIKRMTTASQSGKMGLTATIAQEDIDNNDYTHMFVWCYCQSKTSEGILYTSGLTLRYPMLYQDGDGTWEPYTGATSSPSPEYPQDIQGVGVRTAQLANLPDIAPTTSNGLTWSCKDGVITVTGTAQKNSDSTTIGLYAELHLQPGTYTVSGYDPDVEVYVRITRADDKTIYYQKSPFVAEATDKLTIIYAQVPTGKTVNKTIYPMLNAGNTALPWEPYGYRTDVVCRTEDDTESYTAPIYTQSPVYQGDKIEYRNGEYGLVRKNGLLTDNGALAWTKYTGGGSLGVNRCFRISVPDMINYPDSVVAANAKLDLLCNRLPSGVFVGQDKPVSVGYSDKQFIYIRLDDDKYADIDTVDQFRAWLADHPVEILYPLDREVWEPLPAISQQALRNLPTYKGTTVIDTTDPLEPEITVSYRAAKKELL